jgi:hypothetical protein
MLVFLKLDITHICEMIFGPVHDDGIKWMLDRVNILLYYLFQVFYKIHKIFTNTCIKKQMKYP